jgi:hypothetical protein
MKWLVFIGIFLVSVSVSAQASDEFKDILEITLRTGREWIERSLRCSSDQG